MNRALLICGIFWVAAATAGAEYPPRELWRADLTDRPYALDVIADVSDDGYPEIVTGTLGDLVICTDGVTGEEWWTFATGGTVWTVAGIGDVNADGQDDVVAGTANNEIHCLSGGSPSGTASELWRASVTGDVWCVARLGDIDGDGADEAVAGAGDNRVVCYSGADGAVLWTYPTGSDVWTVAAIPDLNADGRMEIVAGSADNKVSCLNGATGSALWTYTAGADVWTVGWQPDVNGDGLAEVLAGAASNDALCLSGSGPDGSRLVWRRTTGGDVRALAVDPLALRVAIGSADDRLYLAEAVAGGLVWNGPMGGEVLAVRFIDRPYGLAAGTADSTVTRLDATPPAHSETLWTYPFDVDGNVIALEIVPDQCGGGCPDVVALAGNAQLVCLSGRGSAPTASSHWRLFQ